MQINCLFCIFLILLGDKPDVGGHLPWIRATPVVLSFCSDMFSFMSALLYFKRTLLCAHKSMNLCL